VLSRAVRTVTGVALRPVLLPGNLTVLPAHTDFSAFSPTYLAVFVVAVTAVPVLIYLAGRPRADSVIVPVWDGGMVAFRPRMQHSAMTFSAPTRVTFDALYRPSVSVHRASDDRPEDQGRCTTNQKWPRSSSATCTGRSSAPWNGSPT